MHSTGRLLGISFIYFKLAPKASHGSWPRARPSIQQSTNTSAGAQVATIGSQHLSFSLAHTFKLALLFINHKTAPISGLPPSPPAPARGHRERECVDALSISVAVRGAGQIRSPDDPGVVMAEPPSPAIYSCSAHGELAAFGFRLSPASRSLVQNYQSQFHIADASASTLVYESKCGCKQRGIPNCAVIISTRASQIATKPNCDLHILCKCIVHVFDRKSGHCNEER